MSKREEMYEMGSVEKSLAAYLRAAPLLNELVREGGCPLRGIPAPGREISRGTGSKGERERVFYRAIAWEEMFEW